MIHHGFWQLCPCLQALEVLEGAASSGAFDALRIFTMPGVELDGMLSAKEACDERGTEFKGADWGALRDWEATEQMAVLTTLVR